jgi:putative ABC transport system permease protein
VQRILFNFYLALEGVFSNQLRAFLTALGIIFGVAAVITMLAIGTGAKQSILEQMKLIGTNNIVVTSIIPSPDDNDQGVGQEAKVPWSPGLTLEDLKAMLKTLPTVDKVSPEMEIKTTIIQSAKLEKAKAIGVTNAFFELNNLSLADGLFFHERHLEQGKPVCIIGKSIQKRFFSDENPIGQKIKCGNTWLKIIGVLERRNASKENLESLGIRDYNSDVYIPISTALLRFKNRALVTRSDIKRGDWDEGDSKDENYHQLDKVTLRVTDSDKILATRDLVGKILKRRHKIVDYEIRVPEKELEAQQDSQETWNNVLAFIAGISLLVGGIGIMNIMLATVMERIKEIGVRRSLGAKQNDIVYQFLFEAIFISLIGGIIGVILGVSAAWFIDANYGIPTIVPLWAVMLSFVVAVSVGIIFGIFPAQKAARQDPIKALRTD